jgi:ligand-binding sensor domain-containing protein
MPYRKIFFIALFACSAFLLNAQQIPIGQWKTHFAYTKSITVEHINGKIYFGSNHLLEYDKRENEFTTYSKINGLSDVNIQLLRYDELSGYMIIIYENSNIDLFKNNTFYNIPDIKNLNIIGSKQINSVYFKNKLMYICSDQGIIVLNPERKEIKETYSLLSDGTLAGITGLCTSNGKFIATTTKGIFTADESSNTLQNYTTWELINSKPLLDLIAVRDSVYAIDLNKLYSLTNGNLTTRYISRVLIKRLRNGAFSNFYICESGDIAQQVSVFDVNANLVDSVRNVNPNDVVDATANDLWVADYWEGSTRITNRHNKSVIQPNGINDNSIYNISYGVDDIFVAAGNQRGWNVTYTPAMISRLKPSGDWVWYNRSNYTAGLENKIDILDVVIDDRNGNLYAASLANGLWEWHPDNTSVTYSNTDFIQPFGGSNRVLDLQFDQSYNLWMTNYGADNQLVVKKADGTWQKFAFPYTVTEKTASQIVIDNNDYKWVLAPRGIGIFVLNDNHTIDNKNDDQIKYLRNGEGNGNLPSNDINCLEKDKTGKIWVGTPKGIGIFNCPESLFAPGGCDAELKIVKYDADADLLFKTESVHTIATDGANNKWVGTENGVWLISDDAEKIIYRFTIDNSPLPSNNINKILVHPKSGEVFIGTDKGLVSFRGQATDGAATNDDLLVFPNPVPSEYVGSIAIKGLVENADVRITDVSGQLIYRTKAQGGQAVWNGKNYTGNKPRSGVYYVFVTNEDGSQTKSGKFIFNE